MDASALYFRIQCLLALVFIGSHCLQTSRKPRGGSDCGAKVEHRRAQPDDGSSLTCGTHTTGNPIQQSHIGRPLVDTTPPHAPSMSKISPTLFSLPHPHNNPEEQVSIHNYHLHYHSAMSLSLSSRTAPRSFPLGMWIYPSCTTNVTSNTLLSKHLLTPASTVTQSNLNPWRNNGPRQSFWIGQGSSRLNIIYIEVYRGKEGTRIV